MFAFCAFRWKQPDRAHYGMVECQVFIYIHKWLEHNDGDDDDDDDDDDYSHPKWIDNVIVKVILEVIKNNVV